MKIMFSLVQFLNRLGRRAEGVGMGGGELKEQFWQNSRLNHTHRDRFFLGPGQVGAHLGHFWSRNIEMQILRLQH